LYLLVRGSFVTTVCPTCSFWLWTTFGFSNWRSGTSWQHWFHASSKS